MDRGKLTIKSDSVNIENILPSYLKDNIELTPAISDKEKFYENIDLLNEIEEDEIIKVDKVLFKKTLSRLVAMQIMYMIFDNKTYRKMLGKSELFLHFDEMMEFVLKNNYDEWKYFRNKQLARNFIKELVTFINDNIGFLAEAVESCRILFKDDIVMKSLTHCALAEYTMYLRNENRDKEKDYRVIIINEYVTIGEYFLVSNQIKLFNGILESILRKQDEDTSK